MARRTYRPGRTLAVFFGVLVFGYILVAAIGTWKPALGLDLQGGTEITLIAKDQNLTPDSLKEAAAIIDSRVNGSGVSEAEVTTQGGNRIVVAIPGKTRRDLVDTVKRQAQLRFRLVAVLPGATQPQTTTPQALPSSAPTTTAPSQQPSQQPSTRSTKSSSSKNRPPVAFDGAAKPRAAASADPSTSPSATASPSATSSPSGATTATPAPKPNYDAADLKAINDPLTWMNNPDAKSVAAYNAYTCPTKTPVDDNPDLPLVTCDDQGQKYLLSKAVIEGTSLKSASAGIPQNQVNWAVDLTLKGDAVGTFEKISQQLVNTDKQFAIVLDGQVISAPGFTGVITGGNAQITGSFTETEAKSLATSLKFGALPISFADTTVQTIGPSLAGDQLKAGITAGIAGLLLVMIYCLFYYRGLGLVVIASLLVAGATTYALVLLLSKSAGFTLSLPGIAGLIVAVGITADSFIVYFERIRDEMRDGKSMRVAVEAGWARARNTCLAADSVSILAAVVLYVFAAGVVKGFAFALGLSTLIDLVIFFWFTHPMVSLLARYPFFNRGHKLSGLNAESLGIDSITVGGRA